MNISLVLLLSLCTVLVYSEIEVRTTGDFQNVYFPLNGTTITFRVKVANDATFIFVGKLPFNIDTDPYMEVGVGGNRNTFSWVRRKRFDTGILRVATNNFLSDQEFRGFWIKLVPPGGVMMGKANERVPFLSWTDPNPFPITHFGVSTYNGATADWKIDEITEDRNMSPCAPDDVVTTDDPYGFEPVHLVKDFCFKLLTDVRTCREKTFEIQEVAKNWDEAKAFCEAKGQKLASVRNKEQQAKLEQTIRGFRKPVSGVWLAANDRNKRDHFLWRDGSNDLVIFNGPEPIIFPNQDVNPTGNSCLFVSQVGLIMKKYAQWLARSCNDVNYFVCETYA